MPITPSGYVNRPYVRGGNLGEILRLRGRDQADALLRSGEIQSRMWSDLGQQISGGINNYVRERQEAPIRAQEARARELQLRNAEREGEQADRLSRQDTAFMALLEQQPTPDPKEVMSIYGPQRGMQIAQGLHAFGELHTGAVKDARENAGRLAMGLKSLSPTLQAQFWPAVRQAAIKGGLGSEQDIPEQFTAEFGDAVIGWATGQAQEQPSLIQRDPTRDLVDPKTGKVITPGTPAVEKVTFNAPTAAVVNGQRTFIRAGSDGKVYDMAGQAVDGTSVRPIEPQGAEPSYQTREVLNDAGGAVMATFDARTGQFRDPSGAVIKNPRPVPSPLETQDARKFKQAGPILFGVSELSEKINTQQGLIAKMSGSVEKAKAQANYNDDVAEYEALISGFTPLVARALGHTGVLTQQDVDSVKALFPKPGDSKTLRDRKIARINSIIGELEAGANPASPKDEPPAETMTPNLSGLGEGKMRRFTSGPFKGQEWTIQNGQAVQVK